MADGRKIVGGAQRRTRNGVLHQGSIQNLPARIDWPALAPALAAAFGRASKETALDAEWLRRAGALADARYGTNAWLRAR
jgi:lipoate-protein ligase A